MSDKDRSESSSSSDSDSDSKSSSSSSSAESGEILKAGKDKCQQDKTEECMNEPKESKETKDEEIVEKKDEEKVDETDAAAKDDKKSVDETDPDAGPAVEPEVKSKKLDSKVVNLTTTTEDPADASEEEEGEVIPAYKVSSSISKPEPKSDDVKNKERETSKSDRKVRNTDESERRADRDRRSDRRRDDDRSDRRRRDRSRSDSRPRYDRRRRRSYSSERENRKRRSHSSDRNKRTDKEKESENADPEVIPKRQQKTVDILTSKTGGAYIPPAKLRLLQAEITDKSSAAYQRIAWEALKKSIHGYINKVNVDNIGIITRELLRENIVRGRGLVCRSIIQAQAASPTFTHVYAALVSVINSKFPNIGELLLHRLVIQFKRGFRRNDKTICLSASRFVAHLINQRVAHEILALEILTLLVETPTDDSVEVAIAFLKECGMKLQEVSSKGVNAIFEMLKNILHEGKLDKRVQYMIEVVFQVRKDGFKDHLAVAESLELVEEDDQFTHLIMLDEATDTQDILSNYHDFNIKFKMYYNFY